MNTPKTQLSLHRPVFSYTKVQRLLSGLIRNRSLHVNQNRLRSKQYLDVGCGPKIHEAFINLDYEWRPGIDICWDITKGIPLPSSSVQGIFTEHCLEHISLPATNNVLGEFFRILQTGGCVRIIVPDGEIYLTRYAKLLEHKTDEAMPYASNDSFAGVYSPIMSVNRIFRAHGHLFIYDFETLKLLLEQHGFVDIKKEQFASGRDAKLLIDTPSRAVESLYVEATKP